MSLTIEYHEGAVTYISDAGYAAYESEQRDINVDQQRAKIVMWSIVGSIVTIAALVITHLLGG